MKKFLAVLALLSISITVCHKSNHMQAITAILSKYQREYTLLELGKESCLYIPSLPFQPQMIGLALIAQANADKEIRTLCPPYHSSVSIMTPPNLTIHMIDLLSRCEHFDVVIVHDLSSYLKVPYRQLLSVILSLGDHVFICAESKEFDEFLKQSRQLALVSEGLYVSHVPKKGLDLARYTQVKDRASQPRYDVQSTYTHKYFYKPGLEKPLPWIHGINLVTFCMLHGIYPDDMTIRNQLRSMRVHCEDHNDLVLGNFILQGTRLFPIDTKDTRRYADPYKLLDIAVHVFNRGNTRLQNPQTWIDAYYRSLLED